MKKMKKRSSLVGSYLMLSVCIAHGGTEIVPTLASGLSASNTVIYCPTLQVAWDGLKGIIGGPIQMENQDNLLRQLNEGHCPTGTIPEEAHVAMAGFTDKDIVGQIEKALRSKFGNNAPKPPPIFKNKETTIVTYSHLERSLPFPRKFLRSTNSPLKFNHGGNTTDVQYFGVPERSADLYSSQVKILHYSGQDDFSLRLESKIEDEFIVLAKINKPLNLLTAVNETLQHLDANDKGFTEVEVNGKKELRLTSLHYGDFLAIPVVDLNVATNFSQLCDHVLSNKGFEKSWLGQVYQDVRFKMDEKGAVVSSTAFAAGCESKPRRFVFDKPFMLSLWKKNAKQPYLAVWITSPDVLVPFKKK